MANSLHGLTIPFSRPATPSISNKSGFIGIGAMGYFMARNLAKHRLLHSTPLLIWNRTVKRAQKLADELGEERVRVASSIEELVTQCDIIFTNLANDEVVKTIYTTIADILSVSNSLKEIRPVLNLIAEASPLAIENIGRN